MHFIRQSDTLTNDIFMTGHQIQIVVIVQKIFKIVVHRIGVPDTLTFPVYQSDRRFTLIFDRRIVFNIISG